MVYLKKINKIIETYTVPTLVNLFILLIIMFLFKWNDVFVEERASFSLCAYLYNFSSAFALSCMLSIIAVAFTLILQKYSFVIYSIIIALLHLLYCIDFIVVSLWKRHINDYFLKLFFERGMLEEMNLTPFIFVIFGAGYLFFFAIQICIYLFSQKYSHKIKIPKYLNFRWCFLFSFIITLSLFTLYSYNFYANRPKALNDTNMIFWYLPNKVEFKTHKVWQSLGVKQEFIYQFKNVVVDNLNKSNEKKYFTKFIKRYNIPDSLNSENNYNILMLVAEGLRSDALTEDNMPNMYNFSKKCSFIGKNHYSVGASTSEALFGLFSGLTPFYWYQCYTDNINPLFFEILKKLKYKNSVYTTSSLDYRKMNRYIFQENIDTIHTYLKERRSKRIKRILEKNLEKDDWDMTTSYIAELGTRTSTKNYFDFLFFYCTHHNYYYSKYCEKYKPVVSRKYLVEVKIHKKIDQIKNRYKNSVYYLDKMLDRIIKALEENNLLEKTIIIITGDHGEEFLETGRFGHAMALNNYQTQVLFLYYDPQMKKSNFTISSHSDVVPTILNSLNLNVSLSNFFSGKTLFSNYDSEKNCALIVGIFNSGYPVEFSLIKDIYKIHFLNQANSVILNNYFDLNDKQLKNIPDQVKKEATDYLLKQKSYFKSFSN